MRPTFEMDERGVRRPLGDGRCEAVTWDDLQKVEIITTSDGPLAEDFFYLLHGSDGTGCAIPEEGAQALLERLQQLPGFDNEAVILACQSTEEARFVCWVRHPWTEAPESPSALDAVIGWARAKGPLPDGHHRAFVLGPRGYTAFRDFATLEEARRYADDVASEAHDEPLLAYVLDGKFRLVARGTHYAAR